MLYRTDIDHTLPLIIEGLLVQEDLDCLISLAEESGGMIVERIEVSDLRNDGPAKILSPARSVTAGDTVLWTALRHTASLDDVLIEKFFNARRENRHWSRHKAQNVRWPNTQSFQSAQTAGGMV